MRAGSGNTLSLWQATSTLPTFEPLRADVRTDVAIVGAGIAGLSCAYELARRGRRVLVIDEGGIGNGETSRTSAHLASGLDDRGLHKLAAYRDHDGTLYTHSAVCTHLGCIVHWNSVERTWDCPCHGSRFDPRDGHVLNGPANSPLADASSNVPPKKTRRKSVSNERTPTKQPATAPQKEPAREPCKDSERDDVRERGPDTGGGKLRPDER